MNMEISEINYFKAMSERIEEFKKIRERAKEILIEKANKLGIDNYWGPSEYSYVGKCMIGQGIAYKNKDGITKSLSVEIEYSYEGEDFKVIWDANNYKIK